ncbi:unnamed protein product [Cylindrotheca closterium]|uniref:Uncharacterized protein n=1 Tax=Cylindrotheca closterium TaxID=2856 RepID=A0AAD2G5W8_9STRA|nr:unnamed protein product [Cylindrotheca closterium]
MSTPVSIEPPPTAHLRTGSQQEREFQQKIEQMIVMQYHEQSLAEGKLKVASDIEPINSNTKGTAASQQQHQHQQQQQQQQQQSLPPLPPQEQLPATITELATSGDSSDNSIVGASTSSTPWPSAQRSNTLTSHPSQAGVGTGTLLFPEDYQSAGAAITAGYGAIPQPPPQAQLPQAQPQKFDELEQMQQHHQQHDFHYGNPDYNHREDDDDNDSNKKSWCEKCCCLCTPFLELLRQEQLRRSFCYGAIDGTLTGSGIASAFCALGVLNLHTTWEVRLAVFCLSASACFADSLCVAIGHIWTSYVVSSSHALDRAKERKILEDSTGDAKAKLIDMLLARGVLKIDAMSLADTLEGYPDLFVNALVGDSLCAGSEEAEQQLDQEHPSDSMRSSRSLQAFNSWRNFPSYGQLAQLEYELSPEQANVDIVVKESQREGTFMMIGFAMFAILPSLLWLFLPIWIAPSSHVAKGESGRTISPSSLIVSITAIIMWSLGAWKSTFLGSHPMTVGIETVIVLLICVLSAYGMGFLLKYCFGDDVEMFVATE